MDSSISRINLFRENRTKFISARTPVNYIIILVINYAFQLYEFL